MIALRPDQPGQRARQVVSALQPRQHRGEVVPRPPAKLGAGLRVYIDAIEAKRHRPSPTRIFFLPIHTAPTGDYRSILAQVDQIFRPEWRGRADDVTGETERRRSFGGKRVGADHILDVDPTVKELIQLDVAVGVEPAGLNVVVQFREKAPDRSTTQGNPSFRWKISQRPSAADLVTP